ncbi:MAG: hypothetical protein QF724_02855 [Planctomycetota bacterium]|jgi:hypothetical protein|nr:hypothetical protein [Planctomycetota bacterium]MDP6519501.1 hypothetical protein [Planctomycetota bacterium]MDP6837849.1 hypothetical protein [Planctomycetota bacterium]MDP6956449.1 hypothetical protein [Planctomycetota bacterium]
MSIARALLHRGLVGLLPIFLLALCAPPAASEWNAECLTSFFIEYKTELKLGVAADGGWFGLDVAHARLDQLKGRCDDLVLEKLGCPR